MNKRIRELRKQLGLSQREFAEVLGLRQNAISNMENEQGTITERNIITICAQFHVNDTWLRTGEGPMFQEENKRKREYFELFDSFEPVYQDYLLKSAKALLETQEAAKAGRAGKGEGRN